MTTWREERRRDQAARAEQARQDAITATEVEARRLAAHAEVQRAQEDHREARSLRSKVDKRANRDRARLARQARWSARFTAARRWTSAHVVELLIYPLAIVSAVMAIPAVAAFGVDVYDNPTGAALFWITELGMWSFAVATEVSRRQRPDRPVWSLQLGAWVFSAAAFGVNFLHGLETSLFDGLVMGIVSVAGVVAHQLVTAAPRRDRTERAEGRITRRVDRKVTRVRRAAIRDAVARIATDGTVDLVFTVGEFTLGKSWTLRDKLNVPTSDSPAPSTSDAADTSVPAEHDASRPAERTRKPRVGRKATKSVKRGRKYVADYVADARASWSPGVEITPTWARRASGCSAGLSRKVADQLRIEIEADRPTVRPAPALHDSEQEAA